MVQARHDFAAVDAIDSEAIGTPGKRTFRVRVLRGSDAASLWLEKQQLAALGHAIPQLLEQLTSPDQHAEEDAETITLFPQEPTLDFKVGRMALGYATMEDRLVLVAYDVEDTEDEDNPPTFCCRFTREQARVLSKTCADSVAGGRPLCLVCHRPIDPEGHMCPRANGHQKVS